MPFTAIGPEGRAHAAEIPGGGLWRVVLNDDPGSAQYFEGRPEAVEAARIAAGTITLR